jgi:hypothetical protein
MAVRILQWMSCSYRTLKTHELLDGLAFRFSNTTLTSKTKIRSEILDLCRPIIEVGPSDTVEFVHFSVNESVTSFGPNIPDADLIRFILEEEYQRGRPFIWRENTHLDVAFSCTAVLNSCIPLLPTNSTDTERSAIIVQGFHGLQVYANKFWYKHVLEYCNFVAQQQYEVSPELLAQLQRLLMFKKTDVQATPSPNSRMEENRSEPGLEALRHVPDIRRLLSNVTQFRAKMNREDASDKSPESKYTSQAILTIKAHTYQKSHWILVQWIQHT